MDESDVPGSGAMSTAIVLRRVDRSGAKRNRYPV